LAANAPVARAMVKVAKMILKNSEDFITAPYVLSRKYVGNRLGAAVADCGKHLHFFDYGLQSFTWGKKTARACVPFSGDCSSLGPPNRGLEHSLNPVNYFLSTYTSL
jgi:hypothetical protein